MIEKNWKEIIKPSKLEVREESKSENTSTIIAEPLERGYGVTIGNALRRILLSSLQGSAITSIQVQGVLHEFSSIPGVREDLTDIILNVKGIKVRMDYDGVKKIQPNEYLTINSQKKSLYAKKLIRKGEKFSMQNIIIKGPAGGIMPKFINIILNRKSITKIEKDEPITWKSF